MWQAGFAAIPSYPTIQNPVRIRHVVHQSLYLQQIALTCNFTNPTNLLVLYFCPCNLPPAPPVPAPSEKSGLASQHLIARSEKQRYEQVQAYALKKEIFLLRFPCLQGWCTMFLTTGNNNWLDSKRWRSDVCFPFFVALKKSGNLLLNYNMCELLFGVNVKGGFFGSLYCTSIMLYLQAVSESKA